MSRWLDINFTSEGILKELGGNIQNFSISANLFQSERNAKMKYDYTKLEDEPYYAFFNFGWTDVWIYERAKNEYIVYDEFNREEFEIIALSKREAIRKAIEYGVKK